LFNRPTILILMFLFITTGWCQDQGLEHFNKKEFEQARAYYESMIKKGEKSPEVQFGLGASAYEEQDYETAKAAFEKALATADSTLKAKAYYNMGNTLYKAQRREESLAFYRKALELNPKDKDAKYNYELVKYSPPPPQKKQGGQGKSDQKDDKKKNQDQHGNQPKQPDQSSSADEKQQQDQRKKQSNDKEQAQQQQKKNQPQPADEEKKRDSGANQSRKPKSSDLQQAEAILNALKQDEKILQKRQIAHAKSRKLAKDW